MAVPLRHELKFFISPIQYQVLSRTLKATLNPDPNGDENNQYHIRSLYFDTAYDSALYDKINGTANRDKYRIRIYNFSDQMIRLECKSKFRDLISKRSVRITRDLAEQLISADPTGLESTASGLVSDTFREMRTNLLHPVVIVDYLREAYLHPAEEEIGCSIPTCPPCRPSIMTRSSWRSSTTRCCRLISPTCSPMRCATARAALPSANTCTAAASSLRIFKPKGSLLL